MKYLQFAVLLLLSVGVASAASVELINTQPAPPIAGEYADVTFRITNPAGANQIGQLSLGVEENRFITQVSPDITSSRLESGQSITRTLRIFISEDAPEGDLQIVTLVDRDGAIIDTEHDLFVEDALSQAEIQIGEIRTTPSRLLPDTDNNELRITLQNLGEKDAELFSATLGGVGEGVSQSNAYSLIDSVASIDAGEQQTLTYRIDIDESVRESVQSVLDIRYRTQRENSNQYDTFEQVLPVTIEIDDAPYLEIISVEPQTDFVGGTTENTLRMTIANTGQEEAQDVRVRLFPDISFPFLFELTSQYIGAKIAPGENVSVEVTFEILSSAQARVYPVAVELESIVGTTRYAQDAEVGIEVIQEQATNSNTVGVAIILLIVVAAGALGFVQYRKRKK